MMAEEKDGVAVKLQDFGIDVILRPSLVANFLPSKSPSKTVPLLQPLTALIPAAEMFGILGGSGSGKTTLLNAIAGRYDRNSFQTCGSINFLRTKRNAQQAAIATNSSYSVAYVTQDDFLHPYLTVRETLLYAASLKISNPDEATSAVSNVIMELGLKECADSLIGSDDGTSRRGISGGEKRRVSIGLQILTHPTVLAADEPSSGLDSFTAVTVMECLQRLTTHGTTVICSIHQPRSDIFALFHSVLLLSAGGQPVYCGQVNKILDHFAALGYACPEHANPADYFIDLTAIDNSTPAKRDASSERVKKLLDAFRVQNMETQRDSSSSLIEWQTFIMNDPAPCIGWSKQVSILTHRLVLCKRRDMGNLWGAVIQALIEGLVVMAIFWQLPYTSEGISSRSGLAYITISVEYYILMIILIDQYCTDLARLVDREVQDGVYYPTAYLTAHWLVSWPIFLLQSLIYSSCIYFGCGLRSGWTHYLLFLAVNVALAFLINALVWVCVTIQRDFSAASLIGNMNFTFLSLTAGFLVNLDTMPSYVRWVQNISFLSYAYRLVMTNEFSHRVLDLDEGYSVDGNDVLHSYGVGVDDYSTPCAVMLAIAIIYTGVAVTAISLLRFPPTGSAGGSAVDAMATAEEEDEEDFIRRSINSTTYTPLRLSEDRTSLHSIEDDSLPMDLPPMRNSNNGMNKEGQEVEEEMDRAGVRIDVRGVYLNVRVPKRKEILRNVNAAFRPGRLAAVMGGSGSGKTTLLHLLANRVPQACLALSSRAAGSSSTSSSVYDGRGEVLFAGRLFTSTEVRRTIGFVPQFDHHLPSLTVTETLTFHAHLRLRPNPVDRTNNTSGAVDDINALQRKRIREVITVLGLQSCAHVCVGDGAHKGISGGEKRRLSIAIQLLASPRILLLDEVTTGLDAFSARRVVLLLRSLARTPCHPSEGLSGPSTYRTIVLSIHQPRYDVFACFDDILLLSRGDVVWSGGVQAMYQHFHAMNKPFPPLTNPADYLLDISSIDFRSDAREASSRVILRDLIDSFQSSEYLTQTLSMPATTPTPTAAVSIEQWTSKQSQGLGQGQGQGQGQAQGQSQCAPWHVALPLLIWRSFTNLWRQPHLLTNRLSQGLFYALILAAFYAPLGKDQAGVQNRIGCLYELTALCFIGMLSCIAIYPQERDVFYREYPDGLYSSTAFALAYFSISTPLLLLTALGIALVVAAIGLIPSALAILQFAAVIFTFLYVGESIGVAFCSAFQQIGFSVNVMSAVISFLGIMAGYISLNMPVFLDYLARISAIKWGAFIVTNLAFRDQTFTCSADDAACLSTGEEVLQEYDMQAGHGTRSLFFQSLVLVLVTVIYFLLALIAVRLRAWKLSH